MSIFALPILGDWLIYAPLVNTSALVNGAALRKLQSAADPDGETLSDLRSQLTAAPAGEPQPRQGEIRPIFLGLVTTRSCNLDCVYCGFDSAAQGDAMDGALAAAGVDWMAEHAASSGRETLDVHFFGGEPLNAFETIEVAVHRARAVAAQHRLMPKLEIATNGACSEARARFTGDYFQTVVLSFDGFEKIHNRHRPYAGGRGSFGDTLRTAHILRKSPAELCLRVCVAGDNVDQLGEITGWFCEQFNPSTIDFETLQPTIGSERAGLQAPDPVLFFERYLEAHRVARDFGVKAAYSAASIDELRLSFCPVGKDALVLHPDGCLTACYLRRDDWLRRGLDLQLGVLSADGTVELDPAAVDRIRRMCGSHPRCRRCFCRWTCAGGCHVNHSYPGCPDTYDDVCVQTRLITSFLLLEDIGLEQKAVALLQDRAAVERLAFHPDDRWDAGGASYE
jgi:uncharacterized protein